MRRPTLRLRAWGIVYLFYSLRISLPPPFLVFLFTPQYYIVGERVSVFEDGSAVVAIAGSRGSSVP